MIVGKDVYIGTTVKIRRPELVTIGNHVAIDAYTCITTNAIIGDYVHIAQMVTIIGGSTASIRIGNFCNISAGCRLVCASDDFENSIGGPLIPHEMNSLDNRGITLEGFNIIGSDTIVLPGVTMAIGSTIGSGSIITKDTEPWTMYFGRPAVAIRKRNKDKILNDAKLLGY
jgi:dTDP-4-amino-4,6-dideoxy-D-glucose acyltransferase